MSAEFERPMPGYRLAKTHYNDDLQAVAAREMGDANRWVELIWLNRLVPPYLVDDPRRVQDGVLQTGALIKVPAPKGAWTPGRNDDTQIFERDCLLARKLLSETADGDIAVASGIDNLHQQLAHRIVTPRGQARRHPDYGCMVWRLVGRVNGPTAGLLGAKYVREALTAEYRVSSVSYSSAEIQFDSVRVAARVKAIDGGVVDVTVGSAP